MRAASVDRRRVGRQRRFDLGAPAEHGRRRQLQRRALGQQVLGHGAAADVGRALDGRFRVARRPLIGGVQQPRLGGQQRLHGGQVAVAGDDEFANLFGG